MLYGDVFILLIHVRSQNQLLFRLGLPLNLQVAAIGRFLLSHHIAIDAASQE